MSVKSHLYAIKEFAVGRTDVVELDGGRHVGLRKKGARRRERMVGGGAKTLTSVTRSASQAAREK